MATFCRGLKVDFVTAIAKASCRSDLQIVNSAPKQHGHASALEGTHYSTTNNRELKKLEKLDIILI